jgi:hypothetical protein
MIKSIYLNLILLFGFLLHFLFTESNLFAQEVNYVGYASIGYDNIFETYLPKKSILVPPVDFNTNKFTLQKFVNNLQYIFPNAPINHETTTMGEHFEYNLNRSNVGYLFYREQKYQLFDTTINSFDTIRYPINVKGFTAETHPSTGIQSDDPNIIALAQLLANNKHTMKEVITSIIDWTSTNIQYQESNPYLDASNTLINKKGNCINFTNLACALFRALGIPANFQTGNTIEYCLYHAWVGVYVPHIGWIQVEPQVNPYNYSGQIQKYINSGNSDFGIGENFTSGDWIVNGYFRDQYVKQYLNSLKYLNEKKFPEFLSKIDSLIHVKLNTMSTATDYFTKAIYYSTIDSLYTTRSLLDSAQVYGKDWYLYAVYSSKDAIQGIINQKITPKILSPINNSIIETMEFPMIWKKSSYALRYYLQVAEDNSFNHKVIDMVVNDTSVTTKNLINGKSYFWRVCSQNHYEKSPWSSTMTFNINDIQTGVSEISSKEFKIYPNPSSDIITIECKDNQQLKMKIDFYSIDGKLAKTLTLTGKQFINISDLKRGTYLIKISEPTNSGYLKTFTLIKN